LESNVEICERLLEDFNREGVAGVLPYFSEDVEVYDPDMPEGTYRGHAGLRHLLHQMRSGAERMTVRGYELIPTGDRVVALTHTYARREGGDLEVEVQDAHTLTFKDGKIVHWRLYVDRAEALGDAGLDPALARTRPGDLGRGSSSSAA
jgi:ketosteroid isomerase-like protein